MASLAFVAATGKMLIAYPSPFGCALMIPALLISAFQSFAKVTLNCGSSFGNLRVFAWAKTGSKRANGKASATIFDFIGVKLSAIGDRRKEIILWGQEQRSPF